MSAAALVTSTPETISAHADEVIAQTRVDLEQLEGAQGEAALDLYDEVIARLDDARRLARVITQMHPQEGMRNAATVAEQSLDKVMTELSR
jgi:hypothetical protein